LFWPVTARSRFSPLTELVSPRRGDALELTSPPRSHREPSSIHLQGWPASRPCDWGTFASDSTPPRMKRRRREDARDRQGVGADEGFAEAANIAPGLCSPESGGKQAFGDRRCRVRPFATIVGRLAFDRLSTKAGLKDWPCESAGSVSERTLVEARVALRAAFAQPHPVDPRKNGLCLTRRAHFLRFVCDRCRGLKSITPL
jgi:hypothetical protein